jgi:hypothetical protein
MSSFFKGVALFVVITCGVWIAVLWRWEATSRDMNTPDIVVYLGLLPLTVFALALLLRWAWRGAALRQAAAATAAVATAGAAASGGATAAVGSGEEARRHATLQLLAAHIVCAAGSSPSEVLAAAKEGKPRPALDPELRDQNGLPVLSARLPDLDLSDASAALEALLLASRAQRPEWANLALPAHVERALAALHEPLRKTADALAPWHQRFEPAPDAPPHTAPPRRVRVLLGLPVGWSEFENDVARSFAAGVLADEARVPIPPACFVVTTLPGSGEDLLLMADRLLQTQASTQAREGRDDALLVAACHSTISAEAVDALEREGTLYSSARQPKGRMPGEAAAALLLASPDWPADPDADAPAQHLHRPTLVLRDKSIDAPGRVDGATALLTMQQALATSRLGAAAIAKLVSDADQHTPRSAELHTSAQELLPQLDSGEDLRLLATVCGGIGGVAPLIVLACAADAAKAADKPCLAVTFGDPLARLALVVLPGVPLPSQPAAVA